MSGGRLERRLAAEVARASADFGLLEPDDRVMVCVSGGKDSLVLLRLLRGIARRAPFPFSLVAVHLDQGTPGFPTDAVEAHLQREGVPYRIVREDVYGIVRDRLRLGATPCALCSRLRRGILYNVAVELGASKVALGHHRDDVIETLLLNLMYTGQLKAMPPRLRSDDGRNVVIRPLAYVAEADLVACAAELGLPVIPASPCGIAPDLKRKWVKGLVAELARDNPHLRGNLFAATQNVRPSHLLDRELWRALGVRGALEGAAAPRPPRRAAPDGG
ncbi:MAG TPA: tRNA 2-thiocytidine(32) synthetase TtcA [Polyangiaceae bacterium]|nr:tRNA 2-thiocytidine(32) synthetase TtcA [Polyangiaceae bacterium]